ncbi:helix-turn-helix domain-containing protein [Sphingosinicella sp.]|uniref:helix-turn-helix domain-containing protein n=1 Tax=Sphingosinicella sp. TaxID=1917971 RepID=UPI0035B003C9
MQHAMIVPDQGASNGFAAFESDFCRSRFQVEAQRKFGGDFSWCWRSQLLGDLQVTNMACDPVAVRRSQKSILNSSANGYFVTLQLSGNGCIVQNDRCTELRPGDFTIIDGDKPYSIDFAMPVERIILKIPRSFISHRQDLINGLLCMPFDGAKGINKIFKDFLIGLFACCEEIEQSQLNVLSLSLINIFSLTVEASYCGGGHSDLSTHQDGLLRRIKDYIEIRLADPELSIEAIAASHQITSRYLHMLFSQTGSTVATWIRDRRLERCKADFENPALLKKTISETCYSWGFNDLAYFSRTFKLKYGRSPREVRADLGCARSS